jgi:hypothetical protein
MNNGSIYAISLTLNINMIYITNEYCELTDTVHIQNLWEVEQDNVEELYKEFMISKASNLGVVINPHWFNIMNHSDHHSHLKIDEYKILEKKWNKIQYKYTVDKFICDELRGRKLEFINIE